MRPPRSITFADSCWLFLRLLGVVYFVAFVSLAVQITGLVGEEGLLPVGEFLERSREQYGSRAYRLWPTLVWLSPADTFLSVLCWSGAAIALVLVAGLVPTAAAGLVWLLYSSLTIAGQDFLQFQWDALLLETGLLAILYAPPVSRSRLGADPEPPVVVRWVIWMLAFKLTFLSGITKLASGDPTWADWTALTYHYETQPIPAWTSWFVHQLPPWVHAWFTLGMFVVELGVPWLIFLPPRLRRIRLTACALMTLLQVGIAATGNYGFFNLLTIVLYVSLLDDGTIGRLLPQWATHREQSSGRPAGPGIWRISTNVAALGIGVLSVLTLVLEIDRSRGRVGAIDGSWPGELLAWVSPVRSVNGYGLFRVMTTERPEIVIEVSEDGGEWKEHGFRWKAGDVRRRPRFVQPHMPRLDWQMWFAALDPSTERRWLLGLPERMLHGASVMKLLGPSPLQNRARSVRLAYYQYRFTSATERAETGAWWKRELVGYLTDTIGPNPR